MPQFDYEAQTENGEIVSGQIDAVDVKDVFHRLEAERLQVVAIRRSQHVTPPTADARTASMAPQAQQRDVSSGLSDEQLRDLARQLSQLVEKDQPLATGLAAYAAELPPGRYRRRLEQLAANLEQGVPLKQILAEQRLPDEWVILLGIAVEGGPPGQSLAKYMANEEQTVDVRQRLKVLLICWIGLLFLFVVAYLVLIVPGFRPLYEDFEMELPILTLWSISASTSVLRSRGSLIVIPVLVCLLAWCVWRFLLPPRVRDRMIVVVPVLGKIVSYSAISRFSALLAPLIERGLPLPRALRLAGQAAGLNSVTNAAEVLAESVSSGADLDARHGAHGRLPATLGAALQCEQPAGVKAAFISELASWYHVRALAGSRSLSQVLRPACIITIGALALLMLTALFLPLFNLLQNLTG